MSRVVEAVHGLRSASETDLGRELLAFLCEELTFDERLAQYGVYSAATDRIGSLLRTSLFRSLCKTCGPGIVVEPGVHFKHPETFEIGEACFIGTGAYLQGRFDGRCVIGNTVWIGPGAYLDARDLVIEDFVGWGPSARVLGSAHTGVPVNIPIVQTHLTIGKVRIRAGCDVGVGAVILPGLEIGEASIIGAGAVVTRDIPPYSVAAGVPARVLRDREDAPEKPG